MAGLGRKVWGNEVISQPDLQGYLQDQTVMVFSNTAARSAAIPAPTKSMVTLRDDARMLERYDGSAWRYIGDTPVFASLALRDAYFAAPNNAPVAGSSCLCNGTRMTHDGTAWRFLATGTASGTTDSSGIIYTAHGWGQIPVRWGVSLVGQQSDTLTVLAKPLAWSADVTNLGVRFTRTDSNAYFTANPLSATWWAQF